MRTKEEIAETLFDGMSFLADDPAAFKGFAANVASEISRLDKRDLAFLEEIERLEKEIEQLKKEKP